MYSIAILIISVVALVYCLYAFAHSRLLEADVLELERLHQEGLLPISNSLEQDFETVSYLLNAIAPTVYMRQELWVRLYFLCLRASRGLLASSARLEQEMKRLVAYQSGHYRNACARLADYSAE